MGDAADLRVRNLAIPGWRTDHLLPTIQHDEKYRQAIRHADYITLNIGSNDLLQVLGAAQACGPFIGLCINEGLQNSLMLSNLNSILVEIRSLTDAPVVVYDVYNPFQDNAPLHALAVGILPLVNGGIYATAFQHENIKIAYANAAYGSNQAEFVRLNDIHPTIAGQQKLAEIGLQALGLSHSTKKQKK